MEVIKESEERRGGTLMTTFMVGIVGLVRGKSWRHLGLARADDNSPFPTYKVRLCK